jgi:hypothetical protein
MAAFERGGIRLRLVESDGNGTNASAKVRLSFKGSRESAAIAHVRITAGRASGRSAAGWAPPRGVAPPPASG